MDAPLIKIELLAAQDEAELRAHFSRHRAESGRGDHHFMPYTPDDQDGPKGLISRGLDLPLNTLGWTRWFVAWLPDRSRIIGHVDLKSDGLKTGLHRCELGIGIERAFRGMGLGERLMLTAIQFAREADSLDWIDLMVFTHNKPALALYRSLGFTEVGTVRDRFRIEGQRIDDTIMVLPVG